MRHPAFDFHAELGHVGELHCVVRRREDRLGEVLAYLVLVDVERRDELDVAYVIAAETHVHQAWNEDLGRRVAVVVHALHERGRAVARPHDRDPDLSVPVAVLSAVVHAPTSLRTFVCSLIPMSSSNSARARAMLSTSREQ